MGVLFERVGARRGSAVGDRGWACVIGMVLIFMAAPPPRAEAQLRPDRTYYGINRPIPMTLAIPQDIKGITKEGLGEPQIQLLAPVTAEVVERAAAAPGPVDLAALFPTLWTTSAPRLLYAQAVVGEQKIGPAVVLQPMIPPAYARVDRVGNPQFPSEQQRDKTYSGIRAYVDKNIVLETSKGPIEVALRPDVAPNTVWNFRELVDGGFYTDVIFHRVVAANPSGSPFVIQVGDPTGTGRGGPGYLIDLEPSTLPHAFGILSMARTGDPNSNGSQIFICLSRDGTAPLDGKYTSFGQTVRGAEAIQAIAAVPVGDKDRPIDPPMIKTARFVDAPPYGTGPKPLQGPDAQPGAR